MNKVKKCPPKMDTGLEVHVDADFLGHWDKKDSEKNDT